MKTRKKLALAMSSLLLASATAFAAVATLDGGFESGTPNAFWDEASTNFGTPLCTTGACGFGGGTGPRTGSWWAWFGGIGATEVGHLSQDVEIPAGTAILTFWLEIPVSKNDATEFLAVSIDDTEVFRVEGDSESVAPYASGYSQVSVDVSAFADGGTHTLNFDSTVHGPSTTNFFVDDVSLDVEDAATCASEGYTSTKLLWCQKICESDLEGAALDSWIHRWINRYRDLPACAAEEEPVEEDDFPDA